VTISLSDPKMEAIETGVASYDIKPGLLRGAKVKMGENGPYQDVPFEHRTTKRGKGNYIEPASMRAAVNKAMQKAKATGKSIPVANRTDNSILSGMKVSAAMGAQTFRRVSKNSKPDSWIHPEREGIGVFTSTAQAVESIKEQVVADIMKAQSK
jgi:hypothetical protein